MSNTINWANLSFAYHKTNANVRCYYRNGKWGPLEVSRSERLSLHIASTCLHYGQEAFEGLKAFRSKNGTINIFRLHNNAKRLQSSCRGIMMPELPTDIFEQAVITAVQRNKRFVPPYGSGASLYIRPLLIGLDACIGVQPANEYLFLVLVSPVGHYFKNGFLPAPVCIMRGYDRAAPLGTGAFKVGGNYAASLVAGQIAHKKGYAAVLYLDPKTKTFIDECGPANFFAIRNNTYITPASQSILPSITNKSLQQLAKDLGLAVEQRPIPLNELNTFEEAAECGTAAVITPISRIDDLDENRSYIFTHNNQPGPTCQLLYQQLTAIQSADAPDPHHWLTPLPASAK